MTKLLTVNSAAAYWSEITGAPRPHRSTVLRWATDGVGGIQLRAEHLAGRWFVSPEAMEEFRRHTSRIGVQRVDELAAPYLRPAKKGRGRCLTTKI
jgi:hypothetical protein